MTKKDILDYLIKTPWNTNIAIVSEMLDSYAGNGNGETNEDVLIEKYLLAIPNGEGESFTKVEQTMENAIEVKVLDLIVEIELYTDAETGNRTITSSLKEGDVSENIENAVINKINNLDPEFILPLLYVPVVINP